jgi:hypothetical protein
MATAQNIPHLLYRGPKILKDPGNAGIIRPNADLQICEMVSGASGETRTLATPTKPGIRFTLRLKTDGGGDVVVTAPAGLNVALETQATFGDASDLLSLISVTISAGSHRWQTLPDNSGTVISSASASATPSSSVSATASSSPSGTASNTPSSSTSASASASSSPSAS